MNEEIKALPLQTAEPFDLTAAIDFGKKQIIESDYKGVPIFVIPNDMKVENLKPLVDEQLPRPYSLKQAVTLLSEQSFVDYFNRYATDSSTIFVNNEKSEFVAVLDYHDSPNEPAHKRHVATYRCPKTKEWNSWLEANNQKMEQEAFALFIEDNLKEIDFPSGAEMLQIAQHLKAKKDVEFASGVQLQNGEIQFIYTEVIAGQAGVKGELNIPEKIKLIISPFLKGAAYEIEARFRYRVSHKGLVMWFTLIRPHVFSDHAFDEIVGRVTEKMEKGHLVHGVYL